MMSHLYDVQHPGTEATLHQPVPAYHPIFTVVTLATTCVTSWVISPIISRMVWFATMQPEHVTQWVTAICASTYMVYYTYVKIRELMLPRQVKVLLPASDDDITVNPRRGGNMRGDQGK
jgi:hypothetical protein